MTCDVRFSHGVPDGQHSDADARTLPTPLGDRVNLDGEVILEPSAYLEALLNRPRFDGPVKRSAPLCVKQQATETSNLFDCWRRSGSAAVISKAVAGFARVAPVACRLAFVRRATRPQPPTGVTRERAARLEVG